MHLIIYDINNKFIDAISKEVKRLPKYIKYTIYHSRLQDITDKYKSNSLYVSPANSFGSMGGGLDFYLRLTFKGIQKEVQQHIRNIGTPFKESYVFDKFNTKNVPHIPVGKSIIFSLDNKKYNPFFNCWFSCTPTMVLPQDVSKTNNAYLAMKGLIDEIQKIKPNIKYIIISGFCTSVGCMDVKTAAKQMIDGILKSLN